MAEQPCVTEYWSGKYLTTIYRHAKRNKITVSIHWYLPFLLGASTVTVPVSLAFSVPLTLTTIAVYESETKKTILGLKVKLNDEMEWLICFLVT